MRKLRRHPTYRGAEGANPMNGRDTHGYVTSALSVAKLPYEDAEDAEGGISLTGTVTPDGLGRTPRSGSRTWRASSTATWPVTAFHGSL